MSKHSKHLPKDYVVATIPYQTLNAIITLPGQHQIVRVKGFDLDMAEHIWMFQILIIFVVFNVVFNAICALQGQSQILMAKCFRLCSCPFQQIYLEHLDAPGFLFASGDCGSLQSLFVHSCQCPRAQITVEHDSEEQRITKTLSLTLKCLTLIC